MFITKEEIEVILIALMARVNYRRNLLLEIRDLKVIHSGNVIEEIEKEIKGMRNLIDKLSEG